MDKLELIAQRHSVRQYKDIAIEEDKRKVIDDLVSSVNNEHDLTHGKSKAIIDKGEKEVCLIAFVYGQNQGVAHKSKSLKEISNYQEGMPEWYLKGLECALLAPTAINQQKFYFELDGDEVKLKKGKGFYTGIDLGIVRYHFEIGAKRRIYK